MNEYYEDFSIWLLPPPDTRLKLIKLMKNLGKEYSGPVFEPHITLLGDINGPFQTIYSKTRTYASTITKMRIKLSKLDYGNEYFKCIFIVISNSLEISTAHSKCVKMFDLNPRKHFNPHLSILYGHYDLKTKLEIISKIDPSILVDFEVNSIHLVSSSSHIDPKYWKRVAKFKLTG